MKYSPHFPARFSSLKEAESFCQDCFLWYNSDHHHTGIALLTPGQVHTGRVAEVQAIRQATLDKAFAASPVRFGNRRPLVPSLPDIVWINRPAVPVSERIDPCISAVD